MYIIYTYLWHYSMKYSFNLFNFCKEYPCTGHFACVQVSVKYIVIFDKCQSKNHHIIII